MASADGRLDEDFLALIGARIRERRRIAGLTVQELADRAGISRRLMTQIEHGQANPSLVTVTALARALGTDFTVLLEPSAAEAAVEVIGAPHQRLVWSSERGSTAYLLVATSAARAADLWRWRLAPGEVYAGRADPAGSQELFTVTEGSLTVCADGVEHRIEAGEAARLRSDRAYEYRNTATTFVTFYRVVALAH